MRRQSGNTAAEIGKALANLRDGTFRAIASGSAPAPAAGRPIPSSTPKPYVLQGELPFHVAELVPAERQVGPGAVEH